MMPLFVLLFYIKETLRIINFQPRNSHTSPLFRKNSVLNFKDKINLENILFISKSINNLLPSLFNIWLVFSSDKHKYNTSWSSNEKLQNYSYRTNTYGKNSITISAIESWNNSQNNLDIVSLRLLTPNEIKLLLSDKYLKNYSTGTCYSLLVFFLVWTLQIFRACYLVFDFSLFTALLLNLWFKNN